MSRIITILFILILFSLTYSQYHCDWNLVSSGGNTISIGNLYALVSVCQTGVGIIQSTNYLGQIGFWIIDTAMVGIKEEDILSQKLPLKTELFPPKPNPFTRKTLLSYSLSEECDVSIVIYNPIGQIVKQVYVKKQKPGIYSFIFSPDKPLKGVYFLKFTAKEYKATRKLILM